MAREDSALQQCKEPFSFRLRTFGDLLTSTIHPSYAKSEKVTMKPGGASLYPAMPVVNDVMTVSQVIDLVTFLQPHYSELQPLYDFGSGL